MTRPFYRMKRILTMGSLMVVAAGLVMVVTGCSTVEDYSLTSRLTSRPIKTSGLVGTNSTGRVQWQFDTAEGTSLSVNLFSDFTPNYQVYSFVLAEGALDPNSGGSWVGFVTKFDQITKVHCAAIADRWVSQYGADANNALYVGHVKFVRLVPIPSS